MNRNPGAQHVVCWTKHGEQHRVYATVYEEDASRLEVKRCFDRHPDADEVWVMLAKKVPYPEGGDDVASA